MGQERQGGAQAGWARLGDEVLARREQLMLSHTGVAKRGGPSHETVRLIEQRGRPSFRDMSLAQLDNALDWKPGTAKRIVNGTAPEDRADWEAEHTAEERQERAAAVRRTRSKTPAPPENMSVLPLSLDNVPDVEIAGELVSRLTRGRDVGENHRLLGELMALLARLTDDDDDAPDEARRAS